MKIILTSLAGDHIKVYVVQDPIEWQLSGASLNITDN